MLARRWAWVLLAAVSSSGSAAAQGQEATGAAPAPAGDLAAGRALFIGARRLENGGAPCGACHAIGGQGRAFSASFGPDLSGSFVGLGSEAVDGMLQDPPFPSMVPVYAGHALTPAERANLTAFLLAAQGQAPAGGDGGFGADAAVVALVLLAGLVLAGRRRTAPVRRQLLEKAGRQQGETR